MVEIKKINDEVQKKKVFIEVKRQNYGGVDKGRA